MNYIKEIIDNYIKEHNSTWIKFEYESGVSRSTIINAFRRKSKLKMSTIEKLSKYMGIDSQVLIDAHKKQHDSYDKG